VVISHLDAESLNLEAHRVRDRLHRVFRGVIGAAAGKGQLSAHRADIDDAAPACPAHAGKDELAHPNQAEDVGLELPADVVKGNRLDRPGLGVSGVVDQHADRPFGLLHSGDGRGHGLLIGDVQGEGSAPFLGEVLQGLGSARGGVDGVAVRDEVGGRRRADPARAAGDEHCGHGLTLCGGVE